MRKYYSELENLLNKIHNERLTSLVHELLLDNRELELENIELQKGINQLASNRKSYSELENLLKQINNEDLTNIVQDLLLENRALRIKNDQLQKEIDYLSNTIKIDPLTGLFNRRALSNVRDCTVVAMCDIDNFKSINDTYGHDGGDIVLRRVSQILLNNTRRIDCVCRYGGDEFLIAFVGCSLEIAYKRMQKMNDEVKLIPELLKTPTSLSIGLAEAVGKEELDKAITRADAALYISKNNGKNMITVSEGPNKVKELK